MKSVVNTDIFCRALPWSRLLLERGELPDDLNLRWSQRLAAALAPLALAAVVAVPIAIAMLVVFGVSVTAVAALALGLALIGVSLALNAGLVRGFSNRRGPIFAFGGWMFHQVHLFYSAAAYAFCWFEHRLRGGEASSRSR